jgi:hypothetical protein
MNFMIIWAFITSHWNDLMGAVTTTKLFADTADSIRKVVPEQLYSKKITQDHLETSMTRLNDQSIPIEEKEWELNTRQELVKSMVHITAIEAAYDIARGTVILVFFAIVMHYWAQFFTRRKGS